MNPGFRYQYFNLKWNKSLRTIAETQLPRKVGVGGEGRYARSNTEIWQWRYAIAAAEKQNQKW